MAGIDDGIKLHLLTPLWTGDIDHKSGTARETGLIGSLRWWYEAILRSLGYAICDPSPKVKREGPDPCNFSQEKYDKASTVTGPQRLERAGICPACQAYGATGYARRFRLDADLEGGNPCFEPGKTKKYEINFMPPDRSHGWFLGAGLVGDLRLRIVPLHDGFNPMQAIVPLTLVSRFGAVGARTQHGYGVVCEKPIVKGNDGREEGSVLHISDADLMRWCESLPPMEHESTSPSVALPDLRDFFFAKVRFTAADGLWWKAVPGIKQLSHDDANRVGEWVSKGSVPIAPALRNWMRFGNNGQPAVAGVERNSEVWGFAKGQVGEGRRAHLCISCAYRIGPVEAKRWEFRVWGWIPRDAQLRSLAREEFLKDLEDKLQTGDAVTQLGVPSETCKTEVGWTAFDPGGCSLDFLKSLVCGKP